MHRRWSRVLALLAALFFAATLANSAVRIPQRIRFIFRNAPTHAIPLELERQANRILGQVPSGAPILLFNGANDDWWELVWQRALYPSPAYLVEVPGEVGKPRWRALQKLYGIRFAVSIGAPPGGTGTRWIEIFPPVPGIAERTRFGELAR